MCIKLIQERTMNSQSIKVSPRQTQFFTIGNKMIMTCSQLFGRQYKHLGTFNTLVSQVTWRIIFQYIEYP